MPDALKVLLYLLIALWAILLPAALRAQQDSTGMATPKKQETFIKKLQQLGAAETQRSIAKYERLQVQKKQEELLSLLKQTIERAKLYLRISIDSQTIANTLTQTTAELETAMTGFGKEADQLISHRNIAVSGNILKTLLRNNEALRDRLEKVNLSLESFRFTIDSISADSALYTFDNDSATAFRYVEKIRMAAKEIGPADSMINREITKVDLLLKQTINLHYDINLALQKVQLLQKQMNADIFSKDWHHVSKSQDNLPMGILQSSLIKEKLALNYYLQGSFVRIALIMLLSVLFGFLLLNLRHQLNGLFVNDTDKPFFLIFKLPFLSAIIIIFSIFQFVFIYPPFIYSFILWSAAAVALSFVLRGYIAPFWLRCWLGYVLLLLLAGIDNFILFPHAAERIYILLLSISGLALALYILQSKKQHQLKEKQFFYFNWFVVCTQLGAVAANAGGLYNLAKGLMVTGFTGFAIAILFLWTIRLVNELLNALSILHERKEISYSFINLKAAGKEIPPSAYVLVYAGWALLIIRNFYGLDQVVTPVVAWLNEERVIGSYSFSINGIFTFLIVITTSVILSKLVGFFSGDTETGDRSGKVNLGSWVLLIRILIICTGLFLGLAAAGIPLDKLTIVLGALGVGIGLGLQNLVNNLVSGLILAFERPLNIGDLIEYNGQLGTVKKIGFRSSHILLKDGPVVVIPNGDLISNPVTNYTLSRHSKRMKLRITVAGNTNLKLVEKIIREQLKHEKLIMTKPEASIDPVEFAGSGIVVEVLYWVYHLKDGSTTVGNLIEHLQQAFQNNGIELAVPLQQVVVEYPANQKI